VVPVAADLTRHCALCAFQGIAGSCPHHAGEADAVADEVSPGDGEWPHFPGETPRGERRTLDGAVALEHLEMRAWLDYAEAAGERFEVEHRWDG